MQRADQIAVFLSKFEEGAVPQAHANGLVGAARCDLRREVQVVEHRDPPSDRVVPRELVSGIAA